MKPCVVVSQEMGSEGGPVTLEVCDLTGYRFVQTHAIGKLARQHGFRGSESRWLDQGWYRLFARLEERPSVNLTILRPILLEICADRRGVLFLGRGIRELLQGHVPLFSVHIVAPFQTRAERIMQQVNIPRSRAEERVRHSDDENAWFSRYFFRVDWSDRRRYDLVLDTSVLSPREAARRVAETMPHPLEPGPPLFHGGRRA